MESMTAQKSITGLFFRHLVHTAVELPIKTNKEHFFYFAFYISKLIFMAY